MSMSASLRSQPRCHSIPAPMSARRMPSEIESRRMLEDKVGGQDTSTSAPGEYLSQTLNRIDRRGAFRWQIARQGADEEHRAGCDGERGDVERLHAEEQAAKRVGRHVCHAEP